MTTYGSITEMGVNALVTPATVTASVVGTTKTVLDSLALPAGILATVGRNLHMRASGLLTTSAVPVTYNVTVEYGSTVLCSTGVFTPTALLSNALWEMWCDLTSVAAGTVEAQGVFNFYSTVATLNPQAMVNTATVAATITGPVTPRIANTFGGNTVGNNISIRTDLWEVGGLV